MWRDLPGTGRGVRELGFWKTGTSEREIHADEEKVWFGAASLGKDPLWCATSGYSNLK